MEPGFPGAGTADNQHIFVDVILGVFIPAQHNPFCLGQENVLVKFGVNERLNIIRCPPPGAAVFHPMTVFFCIFRAEVNHQADTSSTT